MSGQTPRQPTHARREVWVVDTPHEFKPVINVEHEDSLAGGTLGLRAIGRRSVEVAVHRVIHSTYLTRATEQREQDKKTLHEARLTTGKRSCKVAPKGGAQGCGGQGKATKGAKEQARPRASTPTASPSAIRTARAKERTRSFRGFPRGRFEPRMNANSRRCRSACLGPAESISTTDARR